MVGSEEILREVGYSKKARIREMKMTTARDHWIQREWYIRYTLSDRGSSLWKMER